MSDNSLEFSQTGFKQVGLIEIPKIFYERFTTGIKPFDELLGGQGFLPGSTFTVTGMPGAGKTTFLLQMLEALQINGKLTGYASGEESIEQIAYNSKRLGLSKVQIANITDIDDLCKATEYLDALIIDSFQFITCKYIEKPLALQRHAIKSLIVAAQKNECVVGIIQHITSTGIAKGGTHVPHSVDMNMEIENLGEQLKTVRIYKNRFGRCGEINLMMGDKGFDFEHVVNPEESAKMSNALNKGEKEKQDILDHIHKHKKATIDELNSAIGESWRIAHYLRILTNENQIQKVGRGQEAYWEKAKPETKK